MRTDETMMWFFHKALTYLLTMAVLVGSLVPPAFCHSHAFGSLSHSHHSGQDRSGQDHCGRHDESAHQIVDNGIEGGSVHSHFSFLGMDFSFPLPSEDGANDPLAQDGQFLVIARLTDDFTLVSRVDLAGVIGLFATPLNDIDAEILRTASRNVRANNLTPMCGGAHIDWSGVLLI